MQYCSSSHQYWMGLNDLLSSHFTVLLLSLNHCNIKIREKIFFPIHCTYFCVRHTDGTARILLISPATCHLMVKDYSRPCQRERGKKKERRRRKKAQKKALCCEQDLNPQTLSPQPSVLSVRPRLPAPWPRINYVKNISRNQTKILFPNFFWRTLWSHFLFCNLCQ